MHLIWQSSATADRAADLNRISQLPAANGAISENWFELGVRLISPGAV